MAESNIAINEIRVVTHNISCLTGYVLKGEPVQVIRIRDNNFIDVVNLRNQLIFKVPLSCLSDRVC